jgi:hypothetical protein
MRTNTSLSFDRVNQSGSIRKTNLLQQSFEGNQSFNQTPDE